MNINLLKTFILLTLFLLFAGVQCRKDLPVEPVKPVYIPQELKDYMYFLPGTYWVYQDSATGTLDSVYVTTYARNEVDTVYNKDGLLQGIWEWFAYSTKSSFDGYDCSYDCDASWSTNNSNLVFRTKSKIGDYAGQTTVLFNKFIIGSKRYPHTQYGVVTLTNIYDSLKVKEKIFNNVVKFNDSKNITEDDNETNFYIAKHVGIIRKELINNKQTWDLIRYHIVQ